ncbi:MAG: metal ABC transporter substrate-binding protein [Candidatus Limnocylindrales bacterium]
MLVRLASSVRAIFMPHRAHMDDSATAPSPASPARAASLAPALAPSPARAASLAPALAHRTPRRARPPRAARLAMAAAITAAITSASLAACTGGASPQPAANGLTVVTTSTVFADLVRQVGGDLVSVRALVPPGADVHTYQAKPNDLRALADAKLVVMNGLGLDDWLAKTIDSASSVATVIRLGDDLTGVPLLAGEEPGTRNPHAWMDVSNARRYVAEIGAALESADPDHADAYRSGVTRYDASLATLDSWVHDQVGAIPQADRKLVMFHDAFPYYAQAYGLEVVGVAVRAPGQDPSAGELAALIDAVRSSGARAIFSEDQFPTAIVDQIGRETGARVVANLFDDSLGNEPVTSYEGLIRWDTDQIVAGLR